VVGWFVGGGGGGGGVLWGGLRGTIRWGDQKPKVKPEVFKNSILIRWAQSSNRSRTRGRAYKGGLRKQPDGGEKKGRRGDEKKILERGQHVTE